MIRNRMLWRIAMKNTNGFDRKDVFNYFEENPIYQTRKFNKLGSVQNKKIAKENTICYNTKCLAKKIMNIEN